MRRFVDYLTRRCRTPLDVAMAAAFGYVLGAHALHTWWGLAVFLASLIGVTDIAAERWRHGSTSAARVRR